MVIFDSYVSLPPDKNLYKILIPGPLRESHKIVIDGPSRRAYKIYLFARSSSSEHPTKASTQTPPTGHLWELHAMTYQRISPWSPKLFSQRPLQDLTQKTKVSTAPQRDWSRPRKIMIGLHEHMLESQKVLRAPRQVKIGNEDSLVSITFSSRSGL